MTVLDRYTSALNIALQSVIKWPYRKERDEVLRALLKYVAQELGYELVSKE